MGARRDGFTGHEHLDNVGVIHMMGTIHGTDVLPRYQSRHRPRYRGVLPGVTGFSHGISVA